MKKHTCYICGAPLTIEGVWLCKEHAFEIKKKFDDNSPHSVKNPDFAYHCQICGEWENRVILNDPDWMYTCNVCMKTAVNAYLVNDKLRLNTELRAEKNIFTWLEKWYALNCNGDWEHGYGVTIETQDNPGWRIEIDLKDTCMSDITHNRVSMDNGDNDLYSYEISDMKFIGFGDPMKLVYLLSAFRRIVEENAEK
jgi:hypothetical protein